MDRGIPAAKIDEKFRVSIGRIAPIWTIRYTFYTARLQDIFTSSFCTGGVGEEVQLFPRASQGTPAQAVASHAFYRGQRIPTTTRGLTCSL